MQINASYSNKDKSAPIEISIGLGSDEGLLGQLSSLEARRLRDELTVAITKAELSQWEIKTKGASSVQIG